MKGRHHLRVLVGIATVLLSLIGTVAADAQTAADRYPEKPIRIIVPFPPGGSVDVLARAVGQKMEEHWGQPVVVETRPGGSTLIGTTAAAKSPGDGYTLLVSVSSHTTNPALHPKMPYDTLKDFKPVSLMARTPVVLYANPELPAQDLKELVALARSKRETLNFGSAGTGSMTHLTGEMFKGIAQIDLSHVVYRGGTPALLDVIGGHIPLTFATVGQALPQYRAGQVKALGISSAGRYPSVPEVPTFVEQGFDVVTAEWYGLLAPSGTPPEIIAKLNAEVRRIVALPSLGDRLTAIELVSSTPEELDGFIRSEMSRWGPLITKLGIKAD